MTKSNEFALSTRATTEVNRLSTGLSPNENTDPTIVTDAVVSNPNAVPSTEGRSRRRNTSHLKDVPATLQMRETLRDMCEQVAAKLDKSTPVTKDQMEQIARRALEEADLPEGYLGWMMVMISSAFWKDALTAVPPERRLSYCHIA